MLTHTIKRHTKLATIHACVSFEQSTTLYEVGIHHATPDADQRTCMENPLKTILVLCQSLQHP